MMNLTLKNALSPVYNSSPVSEYAGNPLIEALPPIESDAVIFGKLRLIQKVSEHERTLPSEVRKHITGRVRELVIPLPEYLAVFRMIEGTLLRSYSKKNPLSPSTMHYLHYLDSNETMVQPAAGMFQPEGSAITIEGDSGVGKTYMVKRILNAYPQTIQHHFYKGRELNLPQVVWLFVECPSDGSLVSFCKNILYAIDCVAGTTFYKEALSKRYGKADLLIIIERTVRNFFIGVIVVDEMSNLEAPKNGHAHPLLSFILNLINRSGVPFLFVGNPDMRDVFTQTLRIARRAENGGYINMQPMAKSVWDEYIKALWSIQATDVITPLDGTLANEFRILSKSTPDLASRTFQEAQKCVIGTKDERITLGALQEGQRRALALSKDLLIFSNQNESNQSSNTNDDSAKVALNPVDNNKGTNKRNSNKKLLSDPDRPQHPEFSEKLLNLLTMDRLPLDDLNPRFLVSLSDSEDIMKELSDNELLLDNPLTML